MKHLTPAVNLERALHQGNPWVIILKTKDGPQPVPMKDLGTDLPWRSYIRATADRICADVSKQPNVEKAEVMRLKAAVQLLFNPK